MKISNILLYVLVGALASCDIKDNDVSPSMSFFRIYDNNQFNASFIPLDVVETTEGGYFILSGTRLESSDFVGVSIIQVDEEGKFISESTLPPNFVHPVANWLFLNDTYYFLCMDAISLQAQLFAVDLEGNIADPVGVGLTLPQHASVDGEEFVVLSYDNENRVTLLSIVNPDGSVTNGQAFEIGDGEGVEEPIIDHYTRTGKQFPFTTGRLDNGTYYFNGFFNFTLSLVFTDLTNGASGVVQGQQEDGGFSAIMPISGTQFAAARFNFGDNFIIPNTNLSTSAVTSSVDIVGNSILELVPDARVFIERLIVDERNVLVYASTTKNGQVIIILYDEADGSWLGTDYLGFSNPYEVRSIEKTADEGLVILSETSVVGRFPRASLFKLSPDQLADIIVVD